MNVLNHSFEISAADLAEIFARLQPHLPEGFTRVETRPGGYGLRYVLAQYTGREPQPAEPSLQGDPRLCYVAESQDRDEHLLREKAGVVLSDIYRQAREDWRTAAYVADLREVVQDAPALWDTYQERASALAVAYDYLRAPAASAEWPSAVSRLIDAQDAAMAAAVAFDDRAQEIAQVHDRHLYGRITRDAALEQAGYPEAAAWHIAEPYHYQQTYYSEWGTTPLGEQVRRLVAQQDAHVAKVGRLSGTEGNAQ